jgi:hypothetical protein
MGVVAGTRRWASEDDWNNDPNLAKFVYRKEFPTTIKLLAAIAAAAVLGPIHPVAAKGTITIL